MDALKNFATSTVATAPSPALSGTSLTVTAGDGAKFPAAPFYATCWPQGVQPTALNAEIVRVTAVATDTFTITRAQDGSSAMSIAATWQIEQSVNAGLLAQLLGLSGGTMSGPIAMGSNKITGLANGSAASDAAAFGQITAANAGALPLAGGTMTGPLTLAADPASALQAATKEYADATIPYDALVRSLNPSAWWKLADAVGATSVIDSSGNGYTLPSVSAATFGEPGPIGGAPSDTAVLMTSGQIYNSSGFASLSSFGSGNFSLAACIQPNSGSSPAMVIDTSTTYTGADTGIYLAAGDTQISIDFGVDSTAFTVPAMHSRWNHVIWSFVHATKTSTVYLNGVLLGTFVHAGTPNIGATPQVSIGSQFGGFFAGGIAQCVFFPSALTAAQVLALYNAAPKYGEQENNYVTTPTVVNGTAFTPSTTSNSMVVFQLNSAAAGSYSLTMGSSTGSETTIGSSVAMVAGSDELVTLLVPRGYRVILTLTTTTLAGVKVITNPA